MISDVRFRNKRGRINSVRSVFLAAGLSVVVLGGCLPSEGYPTRPVIIICPWSWGGGTDRVARQLAAFLEEELHVPVSVVNATGGAGVTGHYRGARARPDGHTVTLMTIELNMLHWRKLTTLTWRDFRPVMLINQDPAAVFVRQDSGWSSLGDLETAVREAPGTINASGTATGGIWHLALAGWLESVGLPADALAWVPNNGAGPSLQKLLSRDIEVVCCSLPEARAQLRSGQVRCLGVMADERVPAHEDVPTLREGNADWSMSGWRGVGVPAGTPDTVVSTLASAMRRVVTGKTVLRIREQGAVRETRFPDILRAEGFDGTWQGPDDFAETLEKRDRELGRLLGSPAFAALTTDKVGPYAFPLALCGALVALGSIGLVVRVKEEQGRAQALRLVELIGATIIYIVAAPSVGFLVTGGGIVLFLLVRLGTRFRVSLAVTAVLVPAVYEIFGSALRVPLPRGVFGW